MMSETLLTATVLGAGCACFVSFSWAARRHFVLEGRVPWGMRILILLNLLAEGWFAIRVIRFGVTPWAPAALVLMAAALGLFFWAVQATRWQRLCIAFSGRMPSFICQEGPFRYVRHPFYLSYILFWIATSIATPGLWSWSATVTLGAMYLGLAVSEEKRFEKSGLFREYQIYRDQTSMLIPRLSRCVRAAKRLRDKERIPSGVDQALTRVRKSLRETVGWLSPGYGFSYSNEVAEEQAWLLARNCYVYALFGSTSVALIVADFRMQLTSLSICSALILPLLYGVLLFHVWKLYQTCDTRKFLRSTIATLMCLGIAWGAFTIIMGHLANSNQRTILGATIVGLVTTPIITVPFSAAMAFLIPCGLASAYAIGFVLGQFDPFLMVCLAGFLSFTYVSTVLLNRSSLERTTARLRLQHQNEVISLFLREHQESATEWVWEADTELQFQNISPRFKQALKTLPEEMRKLPLREFAALAEGRQVTGLASLIEYYDQRQAFRDVVLRFELGSETRWWSIVGQPIYDSNARFRGYRGIGSDITEARRSEDQINYLANHDSLTGLPNRARLMAELKEFCYRIEASADWSFALLLLDLDRFKEINDTHGHPTGDALLVAVAERLRRVLRADGFPARLGGDEFAVLLPISDPADPGVVADRIIRTLQEPYSLRDAIVRPGASVGITIGPTDGTEPATLMRNADLALYTAKAGGRGAWQRYRAGMHSEQAARASLRNDLKSAIEAGDFELEYQPIIDLRTRETVAMEALARWNHRTRGIVPPSAFIPLAEETGLIPELGEIVLRRACQVAISWPSYISLAVNLSALQTRDPNFLARVDNALRKSGLSPERLELELTERVLLGNDETSFEIIAGLRKRGVRVILDDFGTGYSSLATLTRFDFDGFKIDREFTASLEADERARVIVRSVGQIATDLRRPVTAEGIETAEQFRILAEFGISRGQGFFIGRPQDPKELFEPTSYFAA